MMCLICNRWINEAWGTRCGLADGHKGPCRVTTLTESPPVHDHTFSAIHGGAAHPAAVDAPLPLDATPAAGATYVPTRAMEEVMALRWQQIHVRGHTATADRALPLDKHFARLLSDMARGAVDYLQFNKRDLARRYLIKLAAMCLATIDRIDAEDASALASQ